MAGSLCVTVGFTMCSEGAGGLLFALCNCSDSHLEFINVQIKSPDKIPIFYLRVHAVKWPDAELPANPLPPLQTTACKLHNSWSG